MADVNDIHSQQISLKITRQKRRKPQIVAPAALVVTPVQHPYPFESELTAGQILSWVDPRFSVRLAIPISVASARTALLHMPPLITVDGDYRAVVGLVALTAALLSVLPANEPVSVKYIDARDPWAYLSMPLYGLLPAQSLSEVVPAISALAEHASGKKPTKSDIALVIGKDRSTVSRMSQKSV